MDDKYYVLDTSGEKMPDCVMTREACMAQLDLCGSVLFYVNGNIEDDTVRQLLNEATYKIRQAYKEVGRWEEIE